MVIVFGKNYLLQLGIKFNVLSIKGVKLNASADEILTIHKILKGLLH